MKIMILDGSIGGASGNTAKVIELFRDAFCDESILTLAKSIFDMCGTSITTHVHRAKSLPLWPTDFYLPQAPTGIPGAARSRNFFETITNLEGDVCFFGKPAAAIVTMHSVGGKEVLSRLQGVLNTHSDFSIPPMSAMTYSYTNQTALSV